MDAPATAADGDAEITDISGFLSELEGFASRHGFTVSTVTQYALKNTHWAKTAARKEAKLAEDIAALRAWMAKVEAGEIRKRRHGRVSSGA